MKSLILVFGFMLFGAAAFAQAEGSTGSAPQVALETNKGRIVIELDQEKAPISVASFLENVEAGIYDGSIFHRVIPNFMIQGGGLKPGMELIPTDKALRNEADNGLANVRGTVAMARRGDPHSASIQFFINVADNAFLNHQDKSQRGWGYTVFGRVVEGIEVADAIAAVPRGRKDAFDDVPDEDVVIISAKLVMPSPEAAPE